MAKTLERLEYLVRVVTTGFGFLVFTLMGLAFRFVACPLLTAFYRDPRKRVLKARWVVQRSFSGFIQLLQCLRVLDLDIYGREKLAQPGLLLCASHPTLIDVVILMSMIPNANCIVKAKLNQSFALRSPVQTSGYIANDSGPGLVEECCASLAQDDTLIIFPEGTRTTPGVSPRLHHGAARVALASGRNITPVRIVCEPPALMKGIAWYQIPKRRMHFTVTVGEAIAVAAFQEKLAREEMPLVVRSLTQEIRCRLFPQLSAGGKR